MFPSLASPDEETTDGVISYVPFSDGYDGRTKPIPTEDESAGSRGASFRSLSSVISRLAARGRPVTCIVCTMALPAVLDVARKHGVPLAVFWNQPATVLAAYYHYYHGYKDLIASNAFDPAYEVALPGLQPLRMQCLPSFLVDKTSTDLSKFVIHGLQELFEFMYREKPKVLVNTFNELEATTLAAMQPYLKEERRGYFRRTKRATWSGLMSSRKVPNWSDQPTIAYLLEEKWRVGTRVYRDDKGIIAGTQLAKGIDFVMGDNEVASKIRERANDLKQKIREETTRGEKSEMSLQIFAKSTIELGKESQSNLRTYKN
uniref:Uncharacterized protein n=1 Tax=Oryza brachyantha TaxID=4533 RepID=J3NBB3_ORYBR